MNSLTKLFINIVLSSKFPSTNKTKRRSNYSWKIFALWTNFPKWSETMENQISLLSISNPSTTSTRFLNPMKWPWFRRCGFWLNPRFFIKFKFKDLLKLVLSSYPIYKKNTWKKNYSEANFSLKVSWNRPSPLNSQPFHHILLEFLTQLQQTPLQPL